MKQLDGPNPFQAMGNVTSAALYTGPIAWVPFSQPSTAVQSQHNTDSYRCLLENTTCWSRSVARVTAR